MARWMKFLMFAVLSVALLPAPGRAAPLTLFLQTPDVLSGTIDVSYDAGTDILSASGFALGTSRIRDSFLSGRLRAARPSRGGRFDDSRLHHLSRVRHTRLHI